MRLTFAGILTAAGLCAAAAVGPTSTTNTCNANNCYRQVKASAFTARPTSQDCSAFFSPTPSPVPAYASNCAPSDYSSACSCIGITSPSAPASSTCNANDCYRQVKASAFPARPTSSDCSAFFAASTSGTVPAYASSCAPSQYSSACSCIGVTSTAAAASPSASSFRLRVTYLGAQPPQPANIYLATKFYPASVAGYDVVLLNAQDDITRADSFTLGAPGLQGTLVITSGAYAGKPEQVVKMGTASFLYIDPGTSSGLSAMLEDAKCSVAANTLTCQVNGAPGVFGLCTNFGAYDYDVFIANSAATVAAACGTNAVSYLISLTTF